MSDTVKIPVLTLDGGQVIVNVTPKPREGYPDWADVAIEGAGWQTSRGDRETAFRDPGSMTAGQITCSVAYLIWLDRRGGA